jgi:hypothetical protein
MSKKRILISLFLPLFLASFVQSQSLAELAKKEKERREALKGKATVVTSADIAKVKKRPAVETVQEQAAGEGEAQAGEAQAGEAQAGEGAAGAQQEGAPPVEGQQAVEAGAGQEQAAAEETPPADAAALNAQEMQKKQKELADLAQDKIEMVELLNLKLNALYQEFQGLDNVKTREMIQLQISDTYDKLLKAEAESAKAKKDLEEFLAEKKKKETPAIWIR